MPQPAGSPVAHVSDTARWVAMYRAMETERPDALFRDPWARQLAGPEGEAIVAAIPKGRELAWPMIVRTQVMDEIILHTLRAPERPDGADTVLNLAAGLDMRPYRLAFPPENMPADQGAEQAVAHAAALPLRWIEADFPAMIAYKEANISGARPRCELERVAVDLTDRPARRALFGRVGGAAGAALVIAEGLLAYLERDEVARLASDLHEQSSFRWWLIDLASPQLLKRLNRSWGKALERAPLIFGPPEGTGFFEPHGWREVEFRSIFEESLRLRRTMRFARFFRFLGGFYPQKIQERFRRMSGVVLLERR